MIKFYLTFIALIFSIASFSNALAAPMFGVKVTGSDLDPASGFLTNGGAGSSSASVSYSTFSAQASFDPLSTYLPTLKAQSTGLDSLFDDDRTQANAMAYQAFTSSIDQTISLNIRLDSEVFNLAASGTLPEGTSGALANVYVYGGLGFSVNDGYCSGQFTFDGVYLCGSRIGRSIKHKPGLSWSNLFNGGAFPRIDDILSFSVSAGESFGIFSDLSAGSFRGYADAFDTLTMDFEDDDGISVIQTPLVQTVPLPAGIWLFATGLLGIFGFRRRHQLTARSRL